MPPPQGHIGNRIDAGPVEHVAGPRGGALVYSWIHEHSEWLVAAAIAILFTVALTVYVFWHNRYVEQGPQKGTAANPRSVRRQNPPDPGT